MNIDNVLRTVAVLAAILLMLSSMNLTSAYQFLSQKLKGKTDTFIEIVNLWHILRDKCEQENLKDAVIKLDETFPLLNKEEENV